MNLTDARRSLADWIDPSRNDREVAATKRALSYREAVRRSRPLLLVSEHREFHGMFAPFNRDVIIASVEEAAAGRVQGHIFSSVTPTNLALQHTDYRKAMIMLEPCLMHVRLGAGL